MKVTIYLKSGNKVSERFVKGVDIKYTNEQITSLTLKRSKYGGLLNKILFQPIIFVKALQLSQIEAITVK